MSEHKSPEFKKLEKNGLSILIKWAEKEGWNPGKYDIDVFWETDPDGFYGYFIDDKMIGGGSVISYNGEFGFMGFFIVKPEFRSLGLGRELWYKRRNTLLSRLKAGAAIGMDGVVSMQQFYRKGGFEIAFVDERHERFGESFKLNKNISEIYDSDIDRILRYDKVCFGLPRPQFLIPWLKMPGVKSFKYLENGKLKGFAIIRKATIGYKICPLFADNLSIAEKLYKACLNSSPGMPFYIDIPLINSDAVTLIKKYKTKYVFECARMYYGNPPQVDISKVFGITTFELG